MNPTEKNILKTITYFSLFRYPITKEEIYSFNRERTDQFSIEKSLAILCREGVIYKLEEFYSIYNDLSLVSRRRLGNQMAAKQMVNAHRAAKILSLFPFVSGLAISGSLSKNYADNHTDIDFFVITRANRLWIARTFMHLFKKFTFLTGKEDWFCMNYYVDEEALEITEKNIFTAMEIVTLLPMHGEVCLSRFFEDNKWTTDFFPSRVACRDKVPEMRSLYINKIIEFSLNNRFGNFLDDFLMKITDKRWNKRNKSKKISHTRREMRMITDKHVSKPDPLNFQQNIIREYEKCVKELLEKKQNEIFLQV